MKLKTKASYVKRSTPMHGDFLVKSMSIGDSLKVADLSRAFMDDEGNIDISYAMAAKILVCVHDMDKNPLEIEGEDESGNPIMITDDTAKVAAIAEGGEPGDVLALHREVTAVNPVIRDDAIEEKKSE